MVPYGSPLKASPSAKEDECVGESLSAASSSVMPQWSQRFEQVPQHVTRPQCTSLNTSYGPNYPYSEFSPPWTQQFPLWTPAQT